MHVHTQEKREKETNSNDLYICNGKKVAFEGGPSDWFPGGKKRYSCVTLSMDDLNSKSNICDVGN